MKKKKAKRRKGGYSHVIGCVSEFIASFFFFVVVVVVLCTYKRPFTVRGNRQKKKENEKK